MARPHVGSQVARVFLKHLHGEFGAGFLFHEGDAYHVTEVILSFDFLLLAIHKSYIWLEATVPVPDRWQEWVLPVNLCSYHHCYRVHECCPFDMVLSEREKHSEFVARNGNRSGDNPFPRYEFLSFVGQFGAS